MAHLELLLLVMAHCRCCHMAALHHHAIVGANTAGGSIKFSSPSLLGQTLNIEDRALKLGQLDFLSPIDTCRDLGRDALCRVV